MFNCRVCLVLSWLLLKVFLGPVLHIHPDTVDCRAAAALLLLLLCEVFETQRVGVTCWWGTALLEEDLSPRGVPHVPRQAVRVTA